MKIAIYGDSYTAGQVNKEINPEPSWVELLAEKFNNITLFGRGGTSLYFSYQSFLKSYKEFDKIIFFATFGNRMYINNPSLTPSVRHMTIQNAFNTDKNKIANNLVKNVFDAAEKYYQYLYDEKQATIIRDLMIKDVKNLRPDAIIFDIEHYINGNDDFFWYDVDPTEAFKSHVDIRHMHFSLEKNITVSNMMIDNLINNKTDIDYELIKQSKPSKKFEDYFIPREQFSNDIAKLESLPLPGITIKELL